MMINAAALLTLPEGTRRRRELQSLLYAVLEREGRLGELSDDERAFARRGYYATLARSAVLKDALFAICDLADRDGVAVLPLKGALLAFAVYPDPGMRPMGDLDLAVRPVDAPRLFARLEADGYRRFGAGRRRFDLRHTHHAIFERDGGPTIELHVRLVHELGADGDVHDFFARAIPVEIAGRRLLAPSWADHFFYLALHAATHGLADSPLWMIDLALCARRVASFEQVIANARCRRAVAALHYAIAAGRRYLPSLAPGLVAPVPAGRAARATALHIALGSDPLGCTPPRWASLLARAALTDRPRDIGRALVDKVALRLFEWTSEAQPSGRGDATAGVAASASTRNVPTTDTTSR